MKEVTKKKKDKEKPVTVEDEIKSLTNMLQRVQADFENYQKRVEKEQKDYIDLGRVLILKKLLPLLDSFEEAVKNNGPEIEPLYRQFQNILKEFNLEPMPVVGEKFDPHVHECVAEECSNKEKGIILDEIQKGFMIDGFIVRHAKVKISKGKEAVKKDDSVKKDSKGKSA